MPKINLLTLVSLFVNFFLAFWLVNQYVSDVYFQNYVNNAIGQYYAFLILTIGVGGGSSLGYLFLKKRHAEDNLASRIQKSKSFKPVGPLASPSTVVASKSILPTGAPPSQVSKHTVYAVPPLPKGTSPSSRSIPSTSWASASKPSTQSTPSSKQELPSRPTPSSVPFIKEPPRTTPSGFTTTPPQPSPPLRSIGEITPRTQSWNLPSPPSEDKSFDSGPAFQKPGLDVNAKQGSSSFSSFPASTKIPDSSPVPSKWAPPPESKPTPSPGQWSDTGVRSIPPLPTKWSPPSGTPGTQDRPSPSQAVPRPGQLPPRGPMGPPQNAPRPFGIPSPGRPGEPRPIAAPQPFRPPLARPPIGPNPNPQQRPAPAPGPPLPRPNTSVGGPMPQPWSPSSDNTERKDPSSLSDLQGSLGKPSLEPKTSPEQSPSGGGGEMDWDTALDTILKTLRKDRVGDTK